MSLAEIRVGLIEAWPKPARLDTRERLSFDAQIAELRGANQAGLWKTICLLAGQIIEAVLKKRLQSLSPQPNLARTNGLGGLLHIAHSRGVLAHPAEARGSSAAIASARILRNWSAHYSLTTQSTNELRATQALALSYCATLYLFDTTIDRPGLYDDGVYDYIQQFLKHPSDQELPDTVMAQFERLCLSAPQFPVSTFTHVVAAVRRRNLGFSALATGLVRHFPLAIARAATTNAKSLQNLTETCLRLGLRDHARVLSVLLPLDGDVLGTLVDRVSPAAVAMYVTHSYRADKDLFRAKFTHGSISDDAIDRMWAGLERKDAGLVNVTQIFKNLPGKLRVRVVRRAPSDLIVAWLRKGAPKLPAHILPLLRDRDAAAEPAVARLRSIVLAEIIAIAKSSDLQFLAPAPNLLRRIQVINDSAAVTILDNILDRVATSNITDGAALDVIRRILWDIVAFSPALAPRALSIAEDVCQRSSPCWAALCLLGVLASSQEALSPTLSAHVHAFDWRLALVPPPDADPWQVYLALVGAVYGLQLRMADLPNDLLNAVVPGVPPGVSGEPSLRLHEYVTAILRSTA
jgi:hypothetical protein